MLMILPIFKTSSVLNGQFEYISNKSFHHFNGRLIVHGVLNSSISIYDQFKMAVLPFDPIQFIEARGHHSKPGDDEEHAHG
jgi:hypothetical protein